MKKLLISVLFCLLGVIFIKSQQVLNPSFEDEPNQFHVPPKNWESCRSASTPDIMPGPWGVNLKPSDGKSYLNLVVKTDGVNEEVVGKLTEILDTNSCYKMTIDFAVSNEFIIDYWGELFDFRKAANVKVGLYSNKCSKSRDTIFNVTDMTLTNMWKTYTAVFKPKDTARHIFIDTYSRGAWLYYGHILVDNITLRKTEDTIVYYDKSFFGKANDIIKLSVKEEEGFAYFWQTDNAHCKTCSSTQFTITDSEDVYIVKQSENGCYKEYHKFSIVMYPEIPNVFTPNNDGINNAFKIKALPPNSKLVVYNRWEQIIFKSENYQNNWDGQEAPDGAYFYILEFTIKDKQYREKGVVSIFR
jgi:gliding motility-associated-like protein